MQFLDKIYNNPLAIDPLPRYAIFTNQTTQGQFGFDVISGAGTKVGGSRHYGPSSEFGNNYDAYAQTNGQLTSQASTYMIQGCPSNGMTGNTYMNLGIGSNHNASGGAYGLMRVNNLSDYFGTSIGEYGVRSKTSFFYVNDQITISPLTTRARYDFITLVSPTHLTTSGEPGTNGYGQLSYNDRTRTLMIVRGNASNQYRAHVWKNPNITLNEDRSLLLGTLSNFITQAKAGTGGASYYYNDFTWSTTNSTGYTESLYHNQFILGDNNIVGMFRMTPSNQMVIANMTLNPASTTTTVSSLYTNSLTTSYGVEQGSASFGSRSQVSWDQDWVISTCPYYYYGGGFMSAMFYTKDPSKYYRFETQSTTGCSVVPSAGSQFVFTTSANSDGNGPYAGVFDPGLIRATGFDASGAAVANGAAISATSNQYFGDSYSTTTNYPALVPVMHRDSGLVSAWGY